MRSEKKINAKPIVRAIILCAGNGSRTGLGYNKILHTVGTKTVLESTLDVFENAGVDSVTLVISPADELRIRELAATYTPISFCYGGKTRAESSKNGLTFIEPCDIVIIHDGARPYVTAEIIHEAITAALEYGSGITTIRCIDTVKQVTPDGKITTLNRDELFNVQTPQAFRYNEIKSAYEKFDKNATDDSFVYESAGFTPHFIQGSVKNKKITTGADLFGIDSENIKIGTGFDVHALVAQRKLILGGIEIPYQKGLDGHSDADVLIHAIMDALLSAAGLPDIGVLFPDTDMKFKDADSTELLKEVKDMIHTNGFKIGNISAVIMAQKPKLAPYIPKIKKRIAEILESNIEQINVSATTTEHLGIIGEEKGMAASCTCILYGNNEAKSK